MHDVRKRVAGKEALHGAAVGEVEALEREARLPQEPVEAGFLQADVVERREVVDPHDGVAVAQQPQREAGADEAGGARDENAHALPCSAPGTLSRAWRKMSWRLRR